MLQKLRELGVFAGPSDKISAKLPKIINGKPEILQEIIAATSFLYGDGISLRERLLCILFGADAQPLCRCCGKPLRSSRREPRGIGYNSTCSTKCSAGSAETRKRCRDTCISKYGVVNPFQSDDKKEKIKRTNLERYGVENPSFSAESRRRRVDTCMERHGVEYWTQQSIPPESLKLLHDKDWLYNEYVINRVPALYIAKNLGISGHKTVCQYLRKYNIEIRHDGWYSKKAIDWLEFIMRNQNIFIRHAENDGEKRLEDLRFFVDGYCESTNTVYEFHGDNFHGNLNRFAPGEHCHPFDKNITAGELNDRTNARERQILDAGYNLIVMWEMDWDSFTK